MTTFQKIYDEALSREGDEETLKAKLPLPKSRDQLVGENDSYYLSVMSRRIFRAGLKHDMVDNKWPAFEEVFRGFDIEIVRMMSDEDLGAIMQDKRIIRHWGKIKSVRQNAQSMYELLNDYKSVGYYLANWPDKEIVQLWDDLKERFNQLGGNSGPYFLRMSGKDTFLLTKFVINALIKWGVVRSDPKSRKSKLAVQDKFNKWCEESGHPLCQVSMILAMSVD